MTPQAFFNLLGYAATESYRQTGIFGSVMLAQAALESNWGRSELAVVGKNLFGIKADSGWRGGVLILPTRECYKGRWVTVNAKWRKYGDWASSITDHAQFFQVNPRYRTALAAQNGKDFARAIHQAGYATDPEYSSKLIRLIDDYNLSRFDTRDEVQDAKGSGTMLLVNGLNCSGKVVVLSLGKQKITLNNKDNPHKVQVRTHE